MRLRCILLIICLLIPLTVAAADPLPSWREGPVKAAILDFVAAVTDPQGPDFTPGPERVAVLDNDGTSWCERPDYAPTRFQARLVGSLAAAGRIDGAQMPYRAWIADDSAALRKYGWKEAYQGLTRAFAGMAVIAFADSARAFLARDRHPRFGRLHTELYYAPMLELMALLREAGFQVWLVTGAEQAFVRSYSEEVLGIPPERVIGSWCTPVYENRGGEAVLVRGDTQVYNGHENKPQNIYARIGRRPIFAAGNSNNDEPMCRWTVTGPRRGLAIWIHHDDTDREYAYGRPGSRIEGLCREHPAAHEVSMTRDWAKVFTP